MVDMVWGREIDVFVVDSIKKIGYMIGCVIRMWVVKSVKVISGIGDVVWIGMIAVWMEVVVVRVEVEVWCETNGGV